jgi:hypothetical protein
MEKKNSNNYLYIYFENCIIKKHKRRNGLHDTTTKKNRIKYDNDTEIRNRKAKNLEGFGAIEY